MDPATSAQPQPLPDHWRAPQLHAGFWRRVAAYLIDFMIVDAVMWLLAMAVGMSVFMPALVMHGVYGTDATWRFSTFYHWPFWLIGWWLYYALCESSKWQATIGKLALGLQVTDLFGRRIGFARASGRYFCMILSSLTLCIGYMMAGWTARKQALHDLIPDCCVVRKAGLAAWQSEPDSGTVPAAPAGATAPLPPRTGMPGWAIALIVVAGCFFLIPVAAILAAIAIPAWQTYTVRAEVSQGLASTERARALFAEYIGERGALPASNADLGLPRPDAIHARYVTSVRVADGKVVVTYGNRANPAIKGGHVVISPVGNAAMLHWHCSSPDIHHSYLPTNCR